MFERIAKSKESVTKPASKATFAGADRRLAVAPLRPILQRKCSACAATELDERVQARRDVSQLGDPLEREADQVADVVLGMPAPEAPRHVPVSSGEKGKHSLMPERAGASLGQDAPDLSSHGGRSLDGGARRFFEPRMGFDFSAVRIHDDADAARSARQIGALAFTFGRDIYFDRGRYQPATDAGRRLLAHELSHAVQQTAPARLPVAPRPAAQLSLGWGPRVSPYRERGSTAFQVDDEPGLVEEPFRHPKKQPWIERIIITFDGVIDDSEKHGAGARAPTGTLVAHYHDNPAKLPDLSIAVTGGSTHPRFGLTDRTSGSTVHRIEGSGYIDSGTREDIAKGRIPEIPRLAPRGEKHSYAAAGGGTMNFAVYFKRFQAIHGGPATVGSHACVHVDFSAMVHEMKQINRHSVIGKTVVEVRYSDAVLKDVCCSRKALGNPNWDSNPCESVKTCP